MDDVLGWQTTRWGMTEQEVAQITADHGVVSVSPPGDYGPFYSPLTIPDVQIGKHHFSIHFQFGKESSRLQQVLIKCDLDPQDLDRTALNATKKILSEKFGAPSRIGTSDDFSWNFPTTMIHLSVFEIRDFVYSICLAFLPSGGRSMPVSAF